MTSFADMKCGGSITKEATKRTGQMGDLVPALMTDLEIESGLKCMDNFLDLSGLLSCKAYLRSVQESVSLRLMIDRGEV